MDQEGMRNPQDRQDMSNRDATLSGKEEVILVFGKEQGKDAWYFVSVSKLKKPILMNMLKNENYDLGSIGKVLESGWGKEPPQTSRKKWLKK
jgi:hypothetical protein